MMMVLTFTLLNYPLIATISWVFLQSDMHTLLSLFSSVFLYFQMQLNEISQPIWVEFIPTLDQSTDKEEKTSLVLIKYGVVSHDGQ